jgi:outer membrane receptor protein involved in Fe transport
LKIAGLFETVTVTPTRSEKRLGEVPVSVNVLEKETIRQSPAVVADDVLRQIPTFSLFRRSSSLSSHPTRQGVSLRGIGPSGVSRTLVLVDGVPFNDPFGGWVYWTRVPLESVDRIEIIDGSSSSLYGNYGMGGVINIVSDKPARRTVDLKTQYGNHSSPKADFFAQRRVGQAWRVGRRQLLRHRRLPDRHRKRARDHRQQRDGRLQEHQPQARLPRERSPQRVRANRLFQREPGQRKRSARSMTRSGPRSTAGVRVRMPDESDLQATIFSDSNTFHATFLAVNPGAVQHTALYPPRSIVRLATDQRVPTDSFGTMVQWSRNFGRYNFFSAGLDWRRVDGDSLEDGYVNGTPIATVGPTAPALLSFNRISGGTQHSTGLFAQDVFSINKVVLTFSVRADNWKNYEGHITETSATTGLPTANNRGDLRTRRHRRESRVGALYRVSDKVSVVG